MNEWISVEDRLPDDGAVVIASIVRTIITPSGSETVRQVLQAKCTTRPYHPMDTVENPAPPRWREVIYFPLPFEMPRPNFQGEIVLHQLRRDSAAVTHWTPLPRPPGETMYSFNPKATIGTMTARQTESGIEWQLDTSTASPDGRAALDRLGHAHPVAWCVCDDDGKVWRVSADKGEAERLAAAAFTVSPLFQVPPTEWEAICATTQSEGEKTLMAEIAALEQEADRLRIRPAERALLETLRLALVNGGRLPHNHFVSVSAPEMLRGLIDRHKVCGEYDNG